MRKYYTRARLLKDNNDAGDYLHRFGMCGVWDALNLQGQDWIDAQKEFLAELKNFWFDDHYHRYYEGTYVDGVFTDWWLRTGVTPDQLRPLICALGFYEAYTELDHVEEYLKHHDWWATNTRKNGPAELENLLPDHAFTLRGVIDRARGNKTEWVEMNDRIAQIEVAWMVNRNDLQAAARVPIKKRTIKNWTYREHVVGYEWPLGIPDRDHDPTNRVVLMVQSQYCQPDARTSTADKARKMYAEAELILPKPNEPEHYDVHNMMHYSWWKYWFRPGDGQRMNIEAQWRLKFLEDLHL